MTDSKDEVAGIEARRAEALIDADIGVLDELTCQSLVHIEANGRQRDKDGFLNALKVQGIRFSRYHLIDNLIRIYGETAVVSGRFENETIMPDGSCVRKHGLHCRIYVRRSDGWKNILHQGTEILP